MLALRNYPTRDKTFLEFLLEVRDRTLSAYDNQGYPFEDLVENILPNRKAGRHSLVDLVFVFQNMEVLPGNVPEVKIPELSLRPYEQKINTSPFDLGLNGAEVGEKLSFTFHYRTKLFKEETIKMLIRNFKEVVSTVLDNKNIKLKDIAISLDLLAVKPDILQEDQGDFEFFD
jgi:non-ribosomal peptide synthetase component F